MKAILILVVVGVVLAVVLFVAGLISPPRSHRWQAFSQRLFRRAESKSDQSAGRIGDTSREALRITRQLTDKSAETGRALHRKAD
jgi:FtsZ-interacting cell division protein ZipA